MISFLNFAVLTSGLLLLIVAYIGIALSLEPPEVVLLKGRRFVLLAYVGLIQ